MDGTAGPAGEGVRGALRGPTCWRAAPRSLPGGSRQPALSRPTGPPGHPPQDTGTATAGDLFHSTRVPVLMVYTARGHQPQASHFSYLPRTRKSFREKSLPN